MQNKKRRYNIDWVSIIAIGLLLLYPTLIGFQPRGIFNGFVTSSPTWPELWPAIASLVQ